MPAVEYKRAKSKSEKRATGNSVKPVSKKPRKNGGELDLTENGGGDTDALDRFRLSESVKSLLTAKGIQRLFPIQAQTFDLVLDGFDVVGRAKTGSGKTLAFVLPIVEQMMKSDKRRTHGRGPEVLCMTPTRELAKQVCLECEYIGRIAGLVSCCVYGGSPYYEQEQAFRRGIDFLIGTPGRIKDHINRGNLNFSHLKYQVLDECDRMLQMGFVEDVEFILNAVGNRDHIQTLLFSATLPPWVAQLLRRFCRPNYRTIDLMSSQTNQSTNCVVHKCVRSDRCMETSIVSDLIQCHADSRRTIVFVDTKANCDKVAQMISASVRARAIHGDLQQKTRDVTLEAFRRGEIDVLVATDVAARGLDIPEVGLVIQTSLPKDLESYIHRAGRTGRAENSGTCISIVSRSTEYLLKRIQYNAGIQFEWIDPPQMADMIGIASKTADEALRSIKAHKMELFKETAQQMLDTWKDPTQLVASALVCLTGHAKLFQKSLLLQLDQHVTLQATASNGSYTSVESASQCILGRVTDLQMKGMRLLEDRSGVVFDVHEDRVEHLLNVFAAGSELNVSVVTSLPRLKPIREWQNSRDFRGRGNYRNGRQDRFNGRSRNYQRSYQRPRWTQS